MSEQVSLNNLFNFPDINSKIYKEKTIQITKLLTDLDSYTNNLQTKVDTLLLSQQQQFKKAYMQHMFKLKEYFIKMQQQIKEHKEKIAYYQNQGRLSILLKRVAELEGQIKKAYDILDEKNKILKQLQLQNTINKKQISSLQQRIKEHIKNNINAQSKLNMNPQNPLTLFTTQISPLKQKTKITKISSEQKSLYNLKSLQKSQELCNYETTKMSKEITQLKKKNKQLILFNSRFLQTANQMQNFFFDVVNDLKKSISIRKKIKECSLEDFRKQDKMELLLQILSNDQILIHLHHKIFGKQIKPFKMSESSKRKNINPNSNILPPINAKQQ